MVLKGSHFSLIESSNVGFFQLNVDAGQERFFVVITAIGIQNMCPPRFFGKSLEDSYAPAHE